MLGIVKVAQICSFRLEASFSLLHVPCSHESDQSNLQASPEDGQIYGPNFPEYESNCQRLSNLGVHDHPCCAS